MTKWQSAALTGATETGLRDALEALCGAVVELTGVTWVTVVVIVENAIAVSGITRLREREKEKRSAMVFFPLFSLLLLYFSFLLSSALLLVLYVTLFTHFEQTSHLNGIATQVGFPVDRSVRQVSHLLHV